MKKNNYGDVDETPDDDEKEEEEFDAPGKLDTLTGTEVPSVRDILLDDVIPPVVSGQPVSTTAASTPATPPPAVRPPPPEADQPKDATRERPKSELKRSAAPAKNNRK